MPFTFVNGGMTSSGGPGGTVAVSITGVSVNDFVIILTGNDSSNTMTVADDAGSTVGALTFRSSSSLRFQMFYILASAGSGTINYTTTYGASSTERTIGVLVFTPTGAVTFDQEAATPGINTTPSSGNITATGTDGIAFGGVCNENSATISSMLINTLAATGDTHSTEAALWYLAYTSGFTNPASASLSVSSRWICGIASFIIAAPPAVRDQDRQVNERLQFSRWTPKTIGLSFDRPVSDRAVASVPSHWVYTQQFGISYLSLNARDQFSLPVSDRAVASVPPHWLYSIFYKTPPIANEHEPVKDQAVAQVNSHWSFISWCNRLFGSPLAHNVVVVITDGTSSTGVNQIQRAAYLVTYNQYATSILNAQSDEPIVADSAAQVPGHWLYTQRLNQPVQAKEDSPVFATNASSLIYSWFVPRWINRLFNASTHTPIVVVVTDGTVSGVNRSWGYGRQYNQQTGFPESNAVKEPSPVASVNRSWTYTQNFSQTAKSFMQSVLDGVSAIHKKLTVYIPTFRPRRR